MKVQKKTEILVLENLGLYRLFLRLPDDLN